MEIIEDKLKNDISKLKIDKNIFLSILKDLKNTIKENKSIIENVNNIDLEITKKQIIVENLNQIINFYENLDISYENNFTRKVIIYNGNPYVTLHLFLQSIVNKVQVVLYYNDFMLGVNEVLIKICDEILKKYKLSDMFLHNEYRNLSEIEKVTNLNIEIVVIGDSTIYQAISSNSKKFFPCNNIILYSDSSEFDKLQDAIYLFATENQYEFEVVYEEEIDDVIDYINLDKFSNIVVLLIKENKEKFKESIKNKKVFINENPFKDEIGIVYNYL